MFDLVGPNYIGLNRYACHVCGLLPERFEYWLDGEFRFCEKCKDSYYRDMKESQGKVYAKFREIAINSEAEKQLTREKQK